MDIFPGASKKYPQIVDTFSGASKKYPQIVDTFPEAAEKYPQIVDTFFQMQILHRAAKMHLVLRYDV